jgi:hypothetical protein
MRNERMKKIILALMLLFSATSFAEQSSGENFDHGPRSRYYRVYVTSHGAYGYYIMINGTWGWPQGSVGIPVWWSPYGISYWNHRGRHPRFETFGAIAYSPETGRYGYAYQAMSRRDAAMRAVSYCGASDCAPVVWTQGGCAVVSVNEQTKGVSFGVSYRKDIARENSHNACESSKENEEQTCRDIAWVCSQ